MRRYRVTGTPQEVSGWGVVTPEYIDATDRKHAKRIADMVYDTIESIEEVSWDEGRGWWWRRERRFKIAVVLWLAFGVALACLRHLLPGEWPLAFDAAFLLWFLLLACAA